MAHRVANSILRETLHFNFVCMYASRLNIFYQVHLYPVVYLFSWQMVQYAGRKTIMNSGEILLLKLIEVKTEYLFY